MNSCFRSIKTSSEKKTPSIPAVGDERQTFRGTTRIRAEARAQTSGNGGEPVPLSGAAPGRTKGGLASGLSAGGPLSLREAYPLFSRSSHLD